MTSYVTVYTILLVSGSKQCHSSSRTGCLSKICYTLNNVHTQPEHFLFKTMMHFIEIHIVCSQRMYTNHIEMLLSDEITNYPYYLYIGHLNIISFQTVLSHIVMYSCMLYLYKCIFLILYNIM